MKIEGYKIDLKNKGNMRDGFDRELKFFVYVLPGVYNRRKLWKIYISVKGYGLIKDVVGAFQKDIPDVEKWIANLDNNGYFDIFKAELAEKAY